MSFSVKSRGYKKRPTGRVGGPYEDHPGPIKETTVYPSGTSVTKTGIPAIVDLYGADTGENGRASGSNARNLRAAKVRSAIKFLTGRISDVAGLDIAPQAVTEIARASTKYGVPAEILTAIYQTESGFGSNMGPSSAGALGHMQFMPATWAEYGNGGDPYNVHDAMDAAGRYLKAAYDQGGSWDDAIYAYNHAQWYVDEINQRANALRPAWEHAIKQSGNHLNIGGAPDANAPLQAIHQAPPYVFPFKHSKDLYWSRTDAGTDFSGEGPISAMGNARILSTGAPGWPGGGGVSYQLTSGPAKGRKIFVFEGVTPTVDPGDTVRKGETIAQFDHGVSPSIETGILGPGGNALAFEKGTADPSSHYSPQGQKFTNWLKRLSGQDAPIPEFGNSAGTSGSITSPIPSVGSSIPGYSSAPTTPTTPSSGGGGGSDAAALRSNAIFSLLSSPIPSINNPLSVLQNDDLLKMALRRKYG